MRLKALREQRVKENIAVQALTDKLTADGYKATTEEEENHSRSVDVVIDLDAKIEKLQTATELQTRGEQSQDPKLLADLKGIPVDNVVRQLGRQERFEETRNLGIEGWFIKRGGGKPEDRHTEAAEKVGIDLDRGEFRITLAPHGLQSPELREARATQSQFQGEYGGFLRPDILVTALDNALLAFGGVRQVASIIRTPTANPLNYPSSNDTGNTGEQLNWDQDTSEQRVSYGLTSLNAYPFSSMAIPTPIDLIRDAAINMVADLFAKIGERIARITNTRFTTGPGDGTCYGIVPTSALGVTAAASTAFTSDELLDLIYSVDADYENMGAKFMFHRNQLKLIRKLKDGEGRYLFQADPTGGSPPTIHGKQFQLNFDMVSTTTSTDKVALFGAFQKFLIRDVGSIEIVQLDQIERLKGNVVFCGFSSHGSNLIDAGTNPVKHLIMA